MSAHGKGRVGYSDEETDRRIHELAARAGIGRGEMVVRKIEPAVAPEQLREAIDTVMSVLANGKPAVAGYIAYRTGLERSTVVTALRALADDGKIVDGGMRRQAKGPRQRMWRLAA